MNLPQDSKGRGSTLFDTGQASSVLLNKFLRQKDVRITRHDPQAGEGHGGGKGRKPLRIGEIFLSDIGSERDKCLKN